MSPRRLLRICLALWLGTSLLHAQWRTESFDLAEGWSAIHVPIDTEHTSITDLFASHSAIQEVWQWNPTGLDSLILEDPDAPVEGTEWKFWKRDDAANSTLSVLAPNRSYLVRADAAVSLDMKGKVVAPQAEWRLDGLNLLGFQTSAATPPTAEAFLGPAELLDQAAEIFGYVGGPLVENTNPQPLQAKFTPMKRNRAFWLRTSKYADYDGPIRVRTALGDAIDFGEDLPTERLVLANRTDREMTVTLTPQDSESAPGQSATPAAVPLLRQVTDATTGQRTYVPFGGNHVVALRAGETLGITVAVDRTALTGPPGTESTSLLQVTDNEGMMETYLPVRATAASLAGLWLGSAQITQVQNQLETTTDLQPTAQSFQLDLIIHVDASGNATVLSQAYVGIIGEDAQGLPVLGVSSKESSLQADELSSASRYTATHLPLNTALALTGAFGLGASPTGSLSIGHNDPANPFLHPFHPDHDNLDARYENTLPAGVESHTITRAFTFSLHNEAPEGLNDPAWGTTLLTGDYSETLSGLHKHDLQTAGIFALRKAASIAALQLP